MHIKIVHILNCQISHLPILLYSLLMPFAVHTLTAPPLDWPGCLVQSVSCLTRARGTRFDTQGSLTHFWKFIIVIFPLPLIQVGQLSVTGEVWDLSAEFSACPVLSSPPVQG